MGYRHKHRHALHGPHEQAYMWVSLIIILALYLCLCLCRKAPKEDRLMPRRTQDVPLNSVPQSQAVQYPRRPRAMTVPTVRPAPAQLAANVRYDMVNEFAISPPEYSAPVFPEISAPSTNSTDFSRPVTNGSTPAMETPPPTYDQAVTAPNSRANTPVPDRKK